MSRRASKRTDYTIPKRKRTEMVEDTILAVLKDNPPMTFQEMFEKAWPTIKAATPSPEETMRLRTYEILQFMADAGKVSKVGKTYTLP